jgi:excisionase family DNA binding protein
VADRLLPIAEVARRLGYDRSHTYALLREGTLDLPVARIGARGHMRVSERALDAWIAKLPHSAPAPAAPAPAPVGGRRRRRLSSSDPDPAGELAWPQPAW